MKKIMEARIQKMRTKNQNINTRINTQNLKA